MKLFLPLIIFVSLALSATAQTYPSPVMGLQHGTGLTSGQVTTALGFSPVPANQALPEVGSFGVVDRTGATDDTAVFQAAANNAPSGAFRVNPGTYLINGAVTDNQSGCHIEFSGQGASIVTSSSASGDIFVLSGYHCSLENVSFDHTVTKSSGADVHCSTAYCNVNNIYDNKPYWAVEIDGNSVLAYISKVSCRNIVPDAAQYGGTCIRVTGQNESSVIFSPFCDIDAVASATTVPTSCIFDDGSDALQIINPNLIHGKYDVYLQASTGKNIYATQIFGGGYLDTPLNVGLLLSAGGLGNIVRTTLNNIGVTDAGALAQPNSAGISVNNYGTGIIQGFACNGCELYNNGPTNFNQTGVVSDVSIVGGCLGGPVSGNPAGEGITPNGITNFSMHGARIGSCDAMSGLAVGLQFYGLSGTVDISDNDFTGAGSPILGINNLTASANSKIHDNIGYNPVGNGTIAVGASPFTYTNGPTASHIYVSGGIVSAVTLAGVGLAYAASGAEYYLAPYQSISVTYSSTPTMVYMTN